MKKVFLCILGAFLLRVFFFTPTVALAHFFQTDKTVTGELHIEPKDNPIPGESAFLTFRFTDTLNRFSVATCTCMVSIVEDNKEIFRAFLAPKNTESLSVYDTYLTYAFPHKDVYTIVLTAAPKAVGVFQPFSLTWNFKVIQNPKPKPINITLMLLFYFTIILVAFILLALIFSGVILLKKLPIKQ